MSIEPMTDFARTIVVVYERGSGDVIHVHEVLTERGGDHPKRKEVETRAIELAADGPRGRTMKRGDMKALALKEPPEFEPDYIYSVDPKRRVLVQTPIKNFRG